MAINIFGGRLNAVYSKVNASISDIPELNSANIRIIFRLDFAIDSYKPTRNLNGFKQLAKDQAYLIDAINDLELETVFMPPSGYEWAAVEW